MAIEELEETADLRTAVAALHARLDRLLVQEDGEGARLDQGSWPTSGMINAMARVGAVVRRGEDFGVVIPVSNTDFKAIKVEWADGASEWVAISEVEWVDSRE